MSHEKNAEKLNFINTTYKGVQRRGCFDGHLNHQKMGVGRFQVRRRDIRESERNKAGKGVECRIEKTQTYTTRLVRN